MDNKIRVFIECLQVITQSNDGGGSTEAVRSMVRVCLRNAAVLNYEKISDFAQQEGKLLLFGLK